MVMVEDTVKKARGDLKRVAARVLTRRDETKGKLARLTARRDELSRDRELAEAAGDAELQADIDRSLGDLSEQIELFEAQHAEAVSTFDQIKEDLSRLDNLEAEARVDTVRRTADALTSGGDPYAPSAEDVALENARNAILELESRLEVERELSGETTQRRDIERKLRELDAAERDAQARKTLEALKEAKKEKDGDPKKRTI